MVTWSLLLLFCVYDGHIPSTAAIVYGGHGTLVTVLISLCWPSNMLLLYIFIVAICLLLLSAFGGHAHCGTPIQNLLWPCKFCCFCLLFVTVM
jgi:hypothetical protein